MELVITKDIEAFGKEVDAKFAEVEMNAHLPVKCARLQKEAKEMQIKLYTMLDELNDRDTVNVINGYEG